MSKNNRSMKALLPALGIVFGAGAGAVVSVFCDFKIAFGVAFGAAVGLLIGAAFQNLFRKKDNSKDGDGK